LRDDVHVGHGRLEERSVRAAPKYAAELLTPMSADKHGEDLACDLALLFHVVEDGRDLLHGNAFVAEAKDAVEVGQREDLFWVVCGLGEHLLAHEEPFAKAHGVHR